MISVMRPRCSPRLVVAVIVGMVVAGCGSGGKVTSHPRPPTASGAQGSGAAAPAPTIKAIPTPRPTGLRADPAAVTVIRAWSSALRRGDVRAAAGYFALPSVFSNGPDANGKIAVITIRTRAEATAINATLPCGAAFVSADQRGRYVNALFKLTNRPGPGGGCSSGTGQVARTNFVIKAGRIVEWLRAPQDPGDYRFEPPASGLPSVPSAPAPPSGPAV